MMTSVTRSCVSPSPLALPPPKEPPKTVCSVLNVPFLGKAPLKTVIVPGATVEPEPPTVRTAKTILCSYKVMQSVE